MNVTLEQFRTGLRKEIKRRVTARELIYSAYSFAGKTRMIHYKYTKRRK